MTDIVVEVTSPTTEIIVDKSPVVVETGVGGIPGKQGPIGPIGPPGESALVIENLTSQVNGTNTIFYTSLHFTAGTSYVTINGLKQVNGSSYEEFPNEGKIVFYQAPSNSIFTDVVEIFYIHS